MNSTKRSKAYAAIERQQFSSDPQSVKRADFAMDKFLDGKMTDQEIDHWANRENEYKEITETE